MKTALAAQRDSDPDPDQRPVHAAAVPLQVVQSNRTEPLSKCVEDSLLAYLHTTDGHDVRDLHRLVIQEVERPMFATVMNHVDGNLSRAAQILGITRGTLRKRLSDYAIERGR